MTALRLKPGDDASCLNLYSPRNPRVAGVTQSFIREGRFRFQSSLAHNEREKNNPWLLLEKGADGGAVPAIVDANSMTYVLHRKIGDVVTVDDGRGAPVKLRLVAALADSIFQSELIIAASQFQRVFDVDALRCPRCGSTLRLLAAIEDPAIAGRILECIDLPARAPPTSAAPPSDGPFDPAPSPVEDADFDQTPPYEEP